MTDEISNNDELQENDLPENTPQADEVEKLSELEQAEIDADADHTSVTSASAIYDTDSDGDGRLRLRGMYREWFLEFASYVILERAVPHIADGLKPVQRRLLHAMKTLDDGRFNKVANIVGNTMQYHPHGDASIGDALVQLGQKDLLIDKQGNWGNVLTGASAAAPRYIEARLSPFALETLYNAKVTEWTPSYDGRKKEPVTLPVKFPLLLAQGAEGIAVGLSSKILPHNFNELLDAAIAYLRGEDFVLYPDFITGGFIDVSRYNDGRRGGAVKIRAKIEKIDNKTLAITEIPYGKTTPSIIESIIKAFENGKIKIRKVDDNTTSTASIVVHLQPGVSSDKAIDALYAFTDCEISVSPNCCVISENKPHFLGVSDVLRFNVNHTKDILKAELEIRRGELLEQLLFSSLERIFISERIYKDKQYEQAPDLEAAIAHVAKRLEPFVKDFWRAITRDDILRLFEIKMKRILRFNADDADRLIESLKAEVENIDHTLENLVEHTIAWFQSLKDRYGAEYPRHTQIRGFDNIEAATVAEANEKLYINREEGFIGTALKKDEFVCPCSSIDDILVVYRDGRYKVVRVADKLSVGKGVLHLAVFKRNDERTIYNIIYQNGRGGAYYMKRCAITGITRDREYNFTPGEPGSRICWFSANSNGEAEVVKVTLKPKPRLKTLTFDVDFADLAIKGRGARGNLVTKNDVHRFSLKEKGASTLGGRQVWFDPDVLRLNYDGRGEYLGEFHAHDSVLVILKDGRYYTSTFDATNHYDDNILRIEKFDASKTWTAVVIDADQEGYPYLKRFQLEPSARQVSFIGDNPASKLLLLTDEPGARLILTLANGTEQTIDAIDFIAVKSRNARGKRLTTAQWTDIAFTEPRTIDELPEELRPVAEPQVEEETHENLDPEADLTDEEIRDKILGQNRLDFDDNEAEPTDAE